MNTTYSSPSPALSVSTALSQAASAASPTTLSRPALLGRTTLIAAIALAALLCLTPRHAAAWEWSWGGKSVSASGNVKSESRDVSGFNGVSVALPATVTIRQGGKEGITIETDENFLPLIETVVDGKLLRIKTKENNMSFRGKFKINITVDAKDVERLSVAGSGDIIAPSLSTSSLKASIAGSGDMKIDRLETASLDVSIAGSGNFSSGGKADAFAVSIAGSGDVRTGKLETNKTSVRISGSGDATVWAKQALSVRVAGSGDVKYYGDPTVSTSIAGSGSAKRLGAAPV
jgi:hypothetical protein